MAWMTKSKSCLPFKIKDREHLPLMRMKSLQLSLPCSDKKDQGRRMQFALLFSGIEGSMDHSNEKGQRLCHDKQMKRFVLPLPKR